MMVIVWQWWWKHDGGSGEGVIYIKNYGDSDDYGSSADIGHAAG